jgi:hypothetical protein
MPFLSAHDYATETQQKEEVLPLAQQLGTIHKCSTKEVC